VYDPVSGALLIPTGTPASGALLEWYIKLFLGVHFADNLA
jgi:hypothetical protein